jgi:low temperature requirement protein LtrA
VATLIQIGNFLSDNVSLSGFAQFAVLMVVVWWAWSGETFYQNRFVVDDLTHRLLVFAQMFAIATLGLSVSRAFGDLYMQFTLAYVVTRLILVLMYARTLRTSPDAGALSRGYILGFGLGIAIWLGSLLLPAQIHWIGWLIGIGVELAVPLLPRMRELQRRISIHQPYIAERFGIFTIIVLGESFVKVLDDAQGITLTAEGFLFSIFGLIVLYGLWWLYFTDTANTAVDWAHRWKPIGWLYGHMPLAASLVTFGVAAKKLFAEAVEHPGNPLYTDYRLLCTAAVALYLLAVALIDFSVDDETTHHSQAGRAMIRLAGAGVVLAAGLLLTGFDATGFVVVVALVMLAQVGYSIVQSTQASLPGQAGHAGVSVGEAGD